MRIIKPSYRIESDVDGDSILKRTTSPAAHPQIPLDFLAVLQHKQTALTEALQWFVRHTKLQSNRWPCPYCGRLSPQCPLVLVEVIFDSGERSTQGCWYCNLEPVIGSAEVALKEPPA